MNHAGRKKFNSSLKLFQLMEGKLREASITFEELSIISNGQKQFLDVSVALYGLPETQSVKHREELKLAINSRMNEWKFFQEWKGKLLHLIQQCRMPQGLDGKALVKHRIFALWNFIDAAKTPKCQSNST